MRMMISFTKKRMVLAGIVLVLALAMPGTAIINVTSIEYMEHVSNTTNYWLFIGPIEKFTAIDVPLGNYSVGDTVKIWGSTNAPAGSVFSMRIFDCPDHILESSPPCTKIFNPYEITVTSQTNDLGDRLFFYDVNTSGHEPGDYDVIVEGSLQGSNFTDYKILVLEPPVLNQDNQTPEPTLTTGIPGFVTQEVPQSGVPQSAATPSSPTGIPTILAGIGILVLVMSGVKKGGW